MSTAKATTTLFTSLPFTGKHFWKLQAFSIRLRWGFHGCTRRLRTVSEEENILHPNGVWLWGAQRQVDMPEIYSRDIPSIHPVKLSNDQSMQMVHDVFLSEFGVGFPHEANMVYPTRPFIPPPHEPPCTYYGSADSKCPPAYD